MRSGRRTESGPTRTTAAAPTTRSSGMTADAIRMARPGGARTPGQSRSVVRRQDLVGGRRWRAARRPAPRPGPRRGSRPTAGERRSRSASSSRTSAQVKSSCWRARLAARPSSPRCSRCPSTRFHTSSTPTSVRPGAGHHRRRPGALAVHEAQRAGELAGRGAGLLLAVAVGLVHRDHVGDLEDALLDALELVAGAGQGEEEERVDHAGDGDLGLPDADRLDQHHVVRRRLEHRHRLAGGAGDAAERAGGRARAGCRRPGRWPAGPSGSCRRGPSRRCGRWTGRPRARRPGAPPRSAGCRAPR